MSGVMAQDVASALQWYIDIGLDEAIAPIQNNRLERSPVTPSVSAASAASHVAPPKRDVLGAAEGIEQARALCEGASSLEDLAKAIRDFDGLVIRKTATNMVFADGVAGAELMVVGEMPDSDDDETGRPFSGESGALLDKMLAAIQMGRAAGDGRKAVYMTHALNWRPPGNRSPSAAETEISGLFLKRHIEFAKPKALLFMGNIPVKALLGGNDTLTKLRGKWLDYNGVPVMVTYPPSFLLKTPAKKREAWDDLQALRDRLSLL